MEGEMVFGSVRVCGLYGWGRDGGDGWSLSVVKLSVFADDIGMATEYESLTTTNTKLNDSSVVHTMMEYGAWYDNIKCFSSKFRRMPLHDLFDFISRNNCLIVFFN